MKIPASGVLMGGLPENMSVIIPAYNESDKIVKSVKAIDEFFAGRGIEYEVIVVDDGSEDSTDEVVETLRGEVKNLRVERNEKNRGKGYSLKRGIYVSNYDYLLFTDADLSAPIKEVVKLSRWIDDYDLVIGSRKAQGAVISIPQPVYRRAMGEFFSVLHRIILNTGVIDSQCGFKLIKRKMALTLVPRIRSDGFCFDVELIYLGKIFGYRIKEVGIQWSDSPTTTINLVKDPLKMLYDLIKIKLMH